MDFEEVANIFCPLESNYYNEELFEDILALQGRRNLSHVCSQSMCMTFQFSTFDVEPHI